jgi:hypothetical protein
MRRAFRRLLLSPLLSPSSLALGPSHPHLYSFLPPPSNRYKEAVESYLEELVVRRELSDNFCHCE